MLKKSDEMQRYSRDTKRWYGKYLNITETEVVVKIFHILTECDFCLKWLNRESQAFINSDGKNSSEILKYQKQKNQKKK